MGSFSETSFERDCLAQPSVGTSRFSTSAQFSTTTNSAGGGGVWLRSIMMKLVNDSRQNIECRLYRVSSSDRRVAMQDLQEHLDIGDQAFVRVEILIEELPRAPFVRVARPHEIHGNVGIDEDQSEPVS